MTPTHAMFARSVEYERLLERHDCISAWRYAVATGPLPDPIVLDRLDRELVDIALQAQRLVYEANVAEVLKAPERERR